MEKNQNKPLNSNELKTAVDQLQQQNRFLIEQLNKVHRDEMYKRMEYLFDVIKNPGIFLEIDKEFVKKCAVELISVLTIDDLQTDSSDEEIKPLL